MNKVFENLSFAKKDRIIQASLVEFAQHGFDKASTNRIVKELGISKGSLYKYFNTKKDLYNYLIKYSCEMLIKHLDTFTISDLSPMEGIIEYASIEYDFLIDNPLVYKFFYNVTSNLNDKELIDTKTQLILLANNYNNKIFNSINLDEGNVILRTHITLIIAGYNKHFMTDCTIDTDWGSLKNKYLKGLGEHLNLVKW